MGDLYSEEETGTINNGKATVPLPLPNMLCPGSRKGKMN